MTKFFFDLIFFFFIILLKPCIYRFLGSESLLALFVFACNRKRGYGGHLYFLITKFLVTRLLEKILFDLSYFLCDVAHKYGDDLIRLSAFDQKSKWSPLGEKKLFLIFFSRFPSKSSIYRFPGSASLLALFVLVCD